MRVGFIGAGQMAQALASGVVGQGQVAAKDIIAADCLQTALDTFQQLLPDAETTLDNSVAAEADVVVIALKPQHLDPVLKQLCPLDPGRLAVSIVAGTTLNHLSGSLSSSRVIRVMPNSPALIGAGAAAFCRGKGVSDDDATWVTHFLEAVGRCWELPESLLDAVTGLSGSGPAFVFQFIEALSDGGVRMGLPRSVATELAAQTVRGAAELIQKSGEHPAVLKDRVASPGGTTIAGLHALENGAFRGAVMAAVQAATERSRELGN